MSLTIENLPAYESISHPEIREKAAALNAARADHEQRRKDVTELGQTRDAAEWRDAEKAEKLRAEGKPEGKRTQVAAHDRKADEARHQLKVAELATKRARDALIEALEQHGEAWRDEVAQACDELDAEWSAATGALPALHTKRVQATATARAIGPDRPGVGVIPIQVRHDLPGTELAYGADPNASLDVATALAKLLDLGKPAPEPEPEPVPREKPKVDFDGLDPLSYEDALAGSPTQSEFEAASAEREARRAAAQ